MKRLSILKEIRIRKFMNRIVSGNMDDNHMWGAKEDRWDTNDDGSISVFGNVMLVNHTMKKFPVKFHSVTGNFFMECPNLRTLEGFPKHVGGEWNLIGNLEWPEEKLKLKFVPNYEKDILFNVEIKDRWSKTNLTLKEFYDRMPGMIKCSRFGV